MRKSIQLITLLILAGSMMTSCVSSKKFKELEAAKMSVETALSQAKTEITTLTSDKETLMTEKSGLEGQVKQIQSDLAGVQKEISSIKDQVTAAQKTITEKEAEITRVRGEVSSAFSDIRTSGLSVTQKGDMIYVSMAEPLLFKSGSARINKSGRAILEKMAGAINSNAGMTVLVEGHTDDKKIRGGSFSSNWDLSTARSVAVIQQLAKNGVAQSKMIAAGRGEFDPVAGNDTDESRKMNRRVEFALIPKVGNLYNKF